MTRNKQFKFKYSGLKGFDPSFQFDFLWFKPRLVLDGFDQHYKVTIQCRDQSHTLIFATLKLIKNYIYFISDSNQLIMIFLNVSVFKQALSSLFIALRQLWKDVKSKIFLPPLTLIFRTPFRFGLRLRRSHSYLVS